MNEAIIAPGPCARRFEERHGCWLGGGAARPRRQRRMEAVPPRSAASPMAPATRDTLRALRDPDRHPPQRQVPLPEGLRDNLPAPLALCRKRFLQNVRGSRRGAAAGPSRCTAEALVDDEASAELLLRAAERLATAAVPPPVLAGVRLGRMMGLQKPDGGVRGLVMSIGPELVLPLISERRNRVSDCALSFTRIARSWSQSKRCSGTLGSTQGRYCPCKQTSNTWLKQQGSTNTDLPPIQIPSLNPPLPTKCMGRALLECL